MSFSRGGHLGRRGDGRTGRDRSKGPVRRVESGSGSSNPMDNLSKQERSQRMSRIRSVDTGPEMVVRRLVHGTGFRYRLHARNLPGTPDMVFPRLGKIIFVHGCFWHAHKGCRNATLPSSNTDYWHRKIDRNRRRDKRVREALRKIGWRTAVIWECKLRDADSVAGRLLKLASMSGGSREKLR